MDIKKEVIEFVSELQAINALVSRVAKERIDFEEYRKIIDFYSENKDCRKFESMILNLAFNENIEFKEKIFVSISNEAYRFIIFYSDNIERLNKFRAYNTINYYIPKHIIEVEDQIKQTSLLGLELHKMIKEFPPLKDDPKREGFDRKLDNLRKQHIKATSHLNELYKTYMEYLDLEWVYDAEIMDGIKEMMITLNNILGKYVTRDIPNAAKQIEYYNTNINNLHNKTEVNKSSMFNMGLISSIYNICRGEQFEDISELDFFNEINNPTSSILLKVKKAETMRVCYLIYLLSETLSEPQRSEWRNAILDKLEISASYYKSKYRNAVSSDASTRSSTFANEMRIVFK